MPIASETGADAMPIASETGTKQQIKKGLHKVS